MSPYDWALLAGRRLDTSAGVADALGVAKTFDVSSAEGLVGREAELAVAAAAVRELCGGRASALVVEGEAGIGKTCLVRSIVDDARSRGVAVFCGQAHPFERTRPFGVVAAALELSRRSPDPRRAAIGALLTGDSAGARAAGDIQYRVVEEIVDLVETASVERPVVLVAEDIHWADGASLLAISSLARQLPLSALLVVITARPSRCRPRWSGCSKTWRPKARAPCGWSRWSPTTSLCSLAGCSGRLPGLP